MYFAERLKNATIRNEVGKLVRSSTLDVLDTPEALAFLLGDRLDSAIRRDLKVCDDITICLRHLTPKISTFFFGHLYHLSLQTPFFNRAITVTRSFYNTPIGSWNNIQLTSHFSSFPNLCRPFVTMTLVSGHLDKFFCTPINTLQVMSHASSHKLRRSPSSSAIKSFGI